MSGVFGKSMKYPNYFNITYILSLGIVLKDSHEKAFTEKKYMKKKEIQNKV
jgi:hypothetical protein